jgi:hypothetical protein
VTLIVLSFLAGLSVRWALDTPGAVAAASPGPEKPA